MKTLGKGYVNESGRRQLANHLKPQPTDPKILRAVHGLDAH